MGWIRIDRKIRDNWVWDAEPKCKAAAWVDLLLRASHQDEVISFDSRPINLKRGQILTSIRKLSNDWGWSKEKVGLFLKDLESTGMIERYSKQFFATVITVVNYGKYQDVPDSEQDTKPPYKPPYKPPRDQDTDSPYSTNKQYKQDKQENNIERTPIFGVPDIDWEANEDE